MTTIEIEMQCLIFNFRPYNSDKERKGMTIPNARKPCAGSQETPKFQVSVAHECWDQFQTTPELQATTQNRRNHHVIAGTSPPITTDQSGPDA